MQPDYFYKDICRKAIYSVQILEILEENGTAVKNTIDSTITSRRRQDH